MPLEQQGGRREAGGTRREGEEEEGAHDWASVLEGVSVEVLAAQRVQGDERAHARSAAEGGGGGGAGGCASLRLIRLIGAVWTWGGSCC